MKQLGSGSVVVTTFTPNNPRISFMCGPPVKWSSASSKLCNEDRNSCSLFGFKVNEHTTRMENLPRMQVTFQNAPTVIRVLAPTTPNTKQTQPRQSSRGVDDMSLFSLSAEKTKWRQSTDQQLDHREENMAEIRLTWIVEYAIDYEMRTRRNCTM